MVFITFFEKNMDYSHQIFEEIVDYSPWFSLNFLKKSWTIVHGFHQIFEEIVDYSPWFSSHFLKKSWTI